MLAYHERTKHAPGRYAASLGYLDWATQPDPWRRFAGAPRSALPLGEPDPELSLDALGGPHVARPLDASTLSTLLGLSLGLTAWKAHGGSRWALRANPSSGNLHPTEGYLLLPSVDGLSSTPAIFHYLSREHALEERAVLSEELWRELAAGLPEASFFVALTSIHWREAWKYGERAYRYCQLDAGHALAAVAYAAGCVGWHARLAPHVDDDGLARLVGLDRAKDFPVAPEREVPELLLAISPEPPESAWCAAPWPDARTREAVEHALWRGRAETLSPDHEPWDVIDEVSRATHKGEAASATAAALASTGHAGLVAPPPSALPDTGAPVSAAHLIRSRRSAQAYDGEATLSAASFFALLDRLLPRADRPPHEAWPYPPAHDLVFFVHRVDELAPGLYLLARTPDGAARLRQALRPDFEWSRPDEAPAHLPFYRLTPGVVTEIARFASCTQEIASDGVFAMSYLARLRPSLEEHGAWFYRALYWEAGALGQVFYLEAEARGLRATGIGCFFDDVVHRLLGLEGEDHQVLYHLAVGRALEDRRLTSLPPYPPPQG